MFYIQRSKISLKIIKNIKIKYLIDLRLNNKKSYNKLLEIFKIIKKIFDEISKYSTNYFMWWFWYQIMAIIKR